MRQLWRRQSPDTMQLTKLLIGFYDDKDDIISEFWLSGCLMMVTDGLWMVDQMVDDLY